MKKIGLASLLSVVLVNAYAINPPGSANNKECYNSAAFVSKGAATECLTSCPQKRGVVVKKELIQKIAKREVNSSNAQEIEQLLGAACSCVPVSAEVWTCQWKGDLTSNRLKNTINVTFEAGMLAKVVAISSDGVTYTAEPNTNVKVYQPQ